MPKDAIEWITGRCALIPPGLTDFIVVSTFFFCISKMFLDFHETHKRWDDNYWEQNQKNNLKVGNVTIFLLFRFFYDSVQFHTFRFNVWAEFIYRGFNGLIEQLPTTEDQKF